MVDLNKHSQYIAGISQIDSTRLERDRANLKMLIECEQNLVWLLERALEMGIESMIAERKERIELYRDQIKIITGTVLLRQLKK